MGVLIVMVVCKGENRTVLFQKEVDVFRTDFKKIDTDNDDCLMPPEIEAMLLEQLGRQPTDKEIKAMMKEFDLNSDGKITWEEYMKAINGANWTVDGSDMAHCAVEETMRYMNQGDYMQIVYVEKSGSSELEGSPLISKYDRFL